MSISVTNVPKLEIIGGFGDIAAGRKEENEFKNACDGSTATCYIPGTKTNSKARFQIPYSVVKHVRILNRLDRFG